MKGRHLRVCGIMLCFFLLLAGFAAAETAQTRYIVVFEGNDVPDNAPDVIVSAGGRFIKALRGVGVAIAVSDNPGFPAALRAMPGILSVSRELSRTIEKANRLRPSSSSSSPLPSGSFLDAQWNIRRVKADRAWHITSGSHNIVVAVIDSGIAWNHPDLKSNVVYAACFKSKKKGGTDTCTCTYQGPGTFKCPSECPCSPYPDLEPHGTNVAGVIAAAFGEGRVVGVAPRVALASYNIAEETVVDGIPIIEAPDGSVLDAMLDAAERGFQVMNLSLGNTIIMPEDAANFVAWNRVVQAVLARGVTIVASAGNDGLRLDGNITQIPAELPGVISVAGTGIRPLPFYPQKGSFDVLSTLNVVECDTQDPEACRTVPFLFTNFGAVIDLVAPGGDCGPNSLFDFANSVEICDERYLILTTDAFPLNAQCAAKAKCQTGYFSQVGTSFAAPHVSAAAALILDRHPYLNPRQVARIINATAQNLGDRVLFGNGMLDVFSAVNR